MKRNQLSYIFAVCVLLFGYQNCQQSGAGPDTLTKAGTTSESLSGNPPQEIPLSGESLQSLDYKTEQVVQVTQGSHTFSLLSEVVYKVDLYDGKFSLVNQSTGQVSEHCLSAALKSELDSILAASSICKYDVSHVSDSQVCGQAIQPHYAELVTNRDLFKLGYATDTCGSNKVDLCSDRGAFVKQFFNKVKAQISLLSCQ